MKSKFIQLTFFVVALLPFNLNAQKAGNDSTVYRHSIDFSPMSPLMHIYAVCYNYHFAKHSELITGPVYMAIPYEDIGHTDAYGFIIGYRHFLWRNLHMDYQLMPLWDHFYSSEEDKRYQGFDLWNEFRLGYQFDFRIKKLPAYASVQWPFGFALYSDPDGKPESFQNYAEENPFFYFPPMIFTGVRF